LQAIPNTVDSGQAIQTGFYEGAPLKREGRLQEMLNTVFDWEPTQTKFHEGTL